MIIAIHGSTRPTINIDVVRDQLDIWKPTQIRLATEPGSSALTWKIASELLPDETYLFCPHDRTRVPNRFWKESGLHPDDADASCLLVELEWPPHPDARRLRDQTLVVGLGEDFDGIFKEPAQLVLNFDRATPHAKWMEKVATSFNAQYLRI